LKQYQFHFEPSNFNASPHLQASLVDSYLQSSTPISLVGSTVYNFSITADPASAVQNRFMVIYKTTSTLPVHFSTVKAYEKQQGVQVEWRAETETNIERYEVEKSHNGQQFKKVANVSVKTNGNTSNEYYWLDTDPNIGSNFYRVRSVSKTGEAKYTEIARVNLNKDGKKIIAYPNPVINGNLTLYLNLDKGVYSLTLTNEAGQQVYKQTINHTGGSASQKVLLHTTMARGVYQLQVSDGEKKYLQQIIKN
jgi:hypothetical protein